MKNIMVLEFENGQFTGAESSACAETRGAAVEWVMADNMYVEWDKIHRDLGSAIAALGKDGCDSWHLASLLRAPSDDGFLRLYMHRTMQGVTHHRLYLWA